MPTDYYGCVAIEGLLQPNWFDGAAIPHNLFSEEEVGNLATTDKLHEPSETESSDEEEWSEDSDDSDCEYDVNNSSKTMLIDCNCSIKPDFKDQQ